LEQNLQKSAALETDLMPCSKKETQKIGMSIYVLVPTLLAVMLVPKHKCI